MEVVAKEVAELEFARFGETMELDFDESQMAEDTLADFLNHKRRIVRAIMNGALVINDNGEPEYSPRRTDDVDKIVFHEPTGATYMAMDRKKKNQDMGKFYAVMGDMTGLSSGALSRLKGPDTKLCQSITALFLA